MEREPKTLQEAIQCFTDPDNCLLYLAKRRWPKGIVCPVCGNNRVGFLVNQKQWQCKSKHPGNHFSIKTGTVFENSPLGLDKWLPAVWLVTNCKNGISSRELHRNLAITKKTA